MSRRDRGRERARHEGEGAREPERCVGSDRSSSFEARQRTSEQPRNGTAIEGTHAILPAKNKIRERERDRVTRTARDSDSERVKEKESEKCEAHTGEKLRSARSARSLRESKFHGVVSSRQFVFSRVERSVRFAFG